jgi:STAS domain-containing protein
MAASEPTTIVLPVGASLAPADLPALCERARILLESTGADVVLCDVSGCVGVDAVTVDALARLQLTARRMGRRACVRHASRELRAFLGFTGLADLCGLPVELERQPEEREERLHVEEEGELADPPV